MPPPTNVKTGAALHCPSFSLPGAQAPNGFVDATPQQVGLGLRSAATPLTDLPNEVQQTFAPMEHTGVMKTLNTPHGRVGVMGLEMEVAEANKGYDKAPEVAKEAGEHNAIPTTALKASPAELLSPATALAVEFLAGVGGTCGARPRAAIDTDANTLTGSEALYSKFEHAATQSIRQTECVFPKKTNRGVKRRTLGDAVEQFKHETQIAAQEFLAEQDGTQLSNVQGAQLCTAVESNSTQLTNTINTNRHVACAGSLYAALAPPAKKRKPRRWLSADEKQFACGIDGCQRAYGSASSLCAHKRAHHPGWKERRREQREKEAAEATARGEAPVVHKDDDEDEEDGEIEKADEKGDDDDGDDGDADVAGRQARKEGSKALDADARATPSGAWIESLAADAHARLGALRRSRQRVQRGLRDARAAVAKLGAPVEDAEAIANTSHEALNAAAASVAAAAAARLLQNMENALETESDNLHLWLSKLERVAELRQASGRVLNVALMDLTGGFSNKFSNLDAPATRAAAKTAQVTADALTKAALTMGPVSKYKKEKQAEKEAKGGVESA